MPLYVIHVHYGALNVLNAITKLVINVTSIPWMAADFFPPFSDLTRGRQQKPSIAAPPELCHCREDTVAFPQLNASNETFCTGHICTFVMKATLLIRNRPNLAFQVGFVTH